MTSQLPCITIKPNAKRHGLFITLLGLLLILFFTLLSQFFWHDARFVLMFCILASIVTLAIGLFKVFEPKVSFKLTPEAINFRHRYGKWRLAWSSVRLIRQVRETSAFSTEALPYIGIKLNALVPNELSISPRLANRLIHEQKGLLIFCINNQLLTTEQSVINFSPYKTSTGEVIKGPLAAFFHQCEVLHKALGYHLYINISSMDRNPEEFANLLNQCKLNAANH